jgi:hypothetical protein
MKKLFFNVLSLTLIAGLVLTSFEDEFTEEQALEQQRQILEALNNADNQNALALAQLDADNALDIAELNAAQQMAFQMYQDSLERVGPVINYSVTVIAAGTVNAVGGDMLSRTSGEDFAPGATVTVTQGGVSRTATADANGIASFSDLRVGRATVSVSAPDHTMLTYTTNLGESDFELTEDNVETTVPLFPTTLAAGATQISGTVWAKLDATTDAAQPVEGALVRARLSVEDVLLDYRIVVGNGNKGGVISASYTDFTITDTTDANGMYTIVVPNGLDEDGSGIWDNGSSVIEFLPYEGSQTLLVEQGDTLAVVSKPVRFDNGGGDHVDTDLPGVFAEVSAPMGDGPSGLELDANPHPTDLFESTLKILDGGSDYKEGDLFVFSPGVDQNYAATEDYAYALVNAVDENGAITDIFIVGNETYYIASPGVPSPATEEQASEIFGSTAPEGTGASFELQFQVGYDVFIVNGGANYTDLPEINATAQDYDDIGGNGDVLVTFANEYIAALFDVFDEGDVDIVYGEIVSASGNGDTLGVSGPLASKPMFTVLPVERRTATIEPQAIGVEDGKITFIDGFDDNGAGYTSAPTVTIKSATGMGSGATIVVTIKDGEIDTWTITNPGSGYMGEVNSTDNEGVFETQSDENEGEGFKPGESITNFNYYYGGGTLLEYTPIIL